MKTLSSGDTVTLHGPGAAFSPAWSPDGRTHRGRGDGNPAFVFGTGYFGNVGASAIWIVHLDGAAPTQDQPRTAR